MIRRPVWHKNTARAMRAVFHRSNDYSRSHQASTTTTTTTATQTHILPFPPPSDFIGAGEGDGEDIGAGCSGAGDGVCTFMFCSSMICDLVGYYGNTDGLMVSEMS